VRKDVIVSAGSVQSPHILELSGIGNKTILEAAGVQSVIDLPGVGENYQDHAITTSLFKIPNKVETWDVFANPVPNATAFSL
jgi:choline dehydrogenase-like flavoprotein